MAKRNWNHSVLLTSVCDATQKRVAEMRVALHKSIEICSDCAYILVVYECLPVCFNSVVCFIDWLFCCTYIFLVFLLIWNIYWSYFMGRKEETELGTERVLKGTKTNTLSVCLSVCLFMRVLVYLYICLYR